MRFRVGGMVEGLARDENERIFEQSPWSIVQLSQETIDNHVQRHKYWLWLHTFPLSESAPLLVFHLFPAHAPTRFRAYDRFLFGFGPGIDSDSELPTRRFATLADNNYITCPRHFYFLRDLHVGIGISTTSQFSKFHDRQKLIIMILKLLLVLLDVAQ